MASVEESIGKAATKIARDIGANCIVSIERIKKERYIESQNYLDSKITIFKKIRLKVYKKIEYTTKIKKLDSNSITPIKEALMQASLKQCLEAISKAKTLESTSWCNPSKMVTL